MKYYKISIKNSKYINIFNINYYFSLEDSDTSSIIDERSFIRVSTAPARPLTDLEEFKRSTEFILLE